MVRKSIVTATLQLSNIFVINQYPTCRYYNHSCVNSLSCTGSSSSTSNTAALLVAGVSSAFVSMNHHSHINHRNTNMKSRGIGNAVSDVGGGPRRSARLMTLSKRSNSTSSSTDVSFDNHKRKRFTTTRSTRSTRSSNSSRKNTTSSNHNNKTSHNTSNDSKIKSKRNFSTTKNKNGTSTTTRPTLPRTREIQLQQQYNTHNLHIIGVDEAGRGPLAGPVVAAAVILPPPPPLLSSSSSSSSQKEQQSLISGITDSKKITNEEEREHLYQQIISIPNVKYAVAIVNSKRIDEINILQATLEAMTMVVNVLIDQDGNCKKTKIIDGDGKMFTIETQVSATIPGCYVVLGDGGSDGGIDGAVVDDSDDTHTNSSRSSITTSTNENTNKHITDATDAADAIVDNNKDQKPKYYALIDGNRIPKQLSCDAESIIKGDSKEYCIGAASILAKVTRDRIMREYDLIYPQYELSRHKGYPTKAHEAKIKEYGASPIHRRTFAPLKHMTFDNDGKIIK